MTEKIKIGIIGLGFVGGTIHKSFKDHEKEIEVTIIDPALGYEASYNELKHSTAVFICVPSPMNDNGSADTSILTSVLNQLKSINYSGVIISKVTAPPDVYEQLQAEFPNLVHAPEFLTAANAYEDYVNGKFAIIGGSKDYYINIADKIIRLSQKQLQDVLHCSIVEASLAKYAINSFLATKVIFMNELADLAKNSKANWNTVRQLIALDKRTGHSHTQVPGPDGQYGFGGMCFPKDTKALLFYADKIGTKLEVLNTAVEKNNLYRLIKPK